VTSKVNDDDDDDVTSCKIRRISLMLRWTAAVKVYKILFDGTIVVLLCASNDSFLLFGNVTTLSGY